MENNQEFLTSDDSEIIKLDAALTRLENNLDFKAVVMDHFLKDHALEIVYMLALPNQQKVIPELIKELSAIAQFKYHMEVIKSIAASHRYAEEHPEEAEAERTED